MKKLNTALTMVAVLAVAGGVWLTSWATASKTPVGTVSKAIGTCTDMEMSLPTALANPAAVCILDLMDQKITKLPPQISKLVNLEELHLGGTSIVKLPPEIGGLNKLRVLDLMDVPILELPVTVGGLENLRVLDLSDTGLTSFPKVILELHNLEVLNLAFVNIGRIPDSISQLTQLKKLDVTGITMTKTDSVHLKNLLPNVAILGLK